MTYTPFTTAREEAIEYVRSAAFKLRAAARSDMVTDLVAANFLAVADELDDMANAAEAWKDPA